MACCAAAALLFSVVRGIWFRLFPTLRPAPPAAFAPVARRGGPGSPPLPTSPARPRRPSIVGPALAGIAWSLLAYAVVVDVLVVAGAATVDAWTARTALLAAVAAALLLVVGSRPAAARTPERVVVALTTAAATWSVVSLADMHLIAAVELSDHGLLADTLFHGAGLVAAVLALPLLRRTAPSSAAPRRPVLTEVPR